jgi:hypothetical protein
MIISVLDSYRAACLLKGPLEDVQLFSRFFTQSLPVDPLA